MRRPARAWTDGIYRHSGIGPSTVKSRLPQDSFAALAVLMVPRRRIPGRRTRQATCWRLASVRRAWAIGWADKAQPLPKVDAAETGSWVPVIDWRRPPVAGLEVYSPESGLFVCDKLSASPMAAPITVLASHHMRLSAPLVSCHRLRASIVCGASGMSFGDRPRSGSRDGNYALQSDVS